MPIIRLTKNEAKLVIALMESTITDYRLKDLSTRGEWSGLIETSKKLVSNIKEQIRGSKRNLKEVE